MGNLSCNKQLVCRHLNGRNFLKRTLGQSRGLVIRVILIHLLELEVAGDIIGILSVGC